MHSLSRLLDEVLIGTATISDVEHAINGSAEDAEDFVEPLMRSIQEQHCELVALLLRLKAPVNAADSKGVSPLHMAVFNADHNVMRLLIDSKARVDVQDRHGQTPLFFAPTRAVCERLGAAGANVHALNSKGQSPLHLAAFAGLVEVVAWLLDAMQPGAINLQDLHGRTAAYCASHGEHETVVALLHDRRADLTLRPSKQPRSGRSTRAASTSMLGSPASSQADTASTLSRSRPRTASSIYLLGRTEEPKARARPQTAVAMVGSRRQKENMFARQALTSLHKLPVAPVSPWGPPPRPATAGFFRSPSSKLEVRSWWARPHSAPAGKEPHVLHLDRS
mmetsp:Transcript_66957/g.119023  ORF Transcript_66957/g.119023 Transcript_66957/m.119023 type:complete len:336 (-) Transcript_66957:187-1194(-)